MSAFYIIFSFLYQKHECFTNFFENTKKLEIWLHILSPSPTANINSDLAAVQDVKIDLEPFLFICVFIYHIFHHSDDLPLLEVRQLRKQMHGV